MSSTRGLVADVVRSSYVDGPGHRYVVFMQGCGFNCLVCHNPHTIPTRPTATSRWMTVDELVDDIATVAPFLSGVTVSGGEATRQWEFVDELFRALAAEETTAGLSRLVDSNGDADPEVWDVLAGSMHGAMVDLKALTQPVHRMLTGRRNDRVLASIRHLTELDRLAEVRLLIVPGVNDRPAQLADTARWLSRLDPVPPVVVLGLRHAGARPAVLDFDEATPDHLDAVAAYLVAQGLPPEQVSVRGGQFTPTS